jgi:hypothetical protein
MIRRKEEKRRRWRKYGETKVGLFYVVSIFVLFRKPGCLPDNFGMKGITQTLLVVVRKDGDENILEDCSASERLEILASLELP